MTPPPQSRDTGGEASDRFTTVHARYHVSGYFDDPEDGELIEAVQTRSEAFRLAAARIGPRGFKHTTVYDSMARLDQPELWSVEANGKTCIERRRFQRARPRPAQADRSET